MDQKETLETPEQKTKTLLPLDTQENQSHSENSSSITVHATSLENQEQQIGNAEQCEIEGHNQDSFERDIHIAGLPNDQRFVTGDEFKQRLLQVGAEE